MGLVELETNEEFHKRFDAFVAPMVYNTEPMILVPVLPRLKRFQSSLSANLSDVATNAVFWLHSLLLPLPLGELF